MPHWPLRQVAWPLAGAGQTWPQEPQLLTSLCSFTQSLLQSDSPAGQLDTQEPCEQETLPPNGSWQTLPQAPQLLLLVCSLTQTPLQLVSPLLQTKPQTPL